MLGGLLLLFAREGARKGSGGVRAFALAVSLATFALSVVMYVGFRPGFAGMQFVEQAEWIPRFGIAYKVGVDGISLLLVMLTTILTPIAILFSFDDVRKKTRLYYMSLLFLETGMLGVFFALDFFLFYVFWEGMLIPMYLIIGVWGGDRRIYAAVKFFLYTMAGSVLMLVAIIWLYFTSGVGTFDILAHFREPVDVPLFSRGCSPRSPYPSPSRCRFSRFTPGCPTPTWKRPRREASSSPASSSRWAHTAS